MGVHFAIIKSQIIRMGMYRMKLNVYGKQDLQKFSNLLNQIEGEKISLQQARTLVRMELNKRIPTTSQRKLRRIKPPTFPSKICECGKQMDLVVLDDKTRQSLWECPKCWLSIYSEKTADQLVEELNQGVR